MSTLTMPDLETELKKWTKEFQKPEGSWQVILYNDNHNKLDNVVLWLQKATGCNHQDATQVVMTCHNNGRAVCFGGDKEKCQRVAGYLRGKGLQVEVDNTPR